MTENKTIGWHHQLDGFEFEQVPGDGEGQGRLACCSLWVSKELDMTWRLNKDKNKSSEIFLTLRSWRQTDYQIIDD